MQSLRYTNFLLTIIAVCLIYQCVKFGAPPSLAQPGYPTQTAAAPSYANPVPVQIVGSPTVKVDGKVKTDTTIVGTPSVDVATMSGVANGRVVMPVQVMNAGNSSGSDRPITINTSTPLDVNLVGLRGDLPVEVKNSTPLRVDCGMPNRPMPVEITNAPISVQLWGVPYPWQVQVTNFPK